MTRGDQRDRDREKNLKKQQAKAKAQPKVGGTRVVVVYCGSANAPANPFNKNILRSTFLH